MCGKVGCVAVWTGVGVGEGLCVGDWISAVWGRFGKFEVLWWFCSESEGDGDEGKEELICVVGGELREKEDGGKSVEGEELGLLV